MNERIKYIKENNLSLYIDLIIELGMLSSRNQCALCNKKIDIKDYHIQLCKQCRLKVLNEKAI